MHAGWNLLARRGRQEAAFLWRMLTVVVLVGLVPAVLSEAIARSLPATAWFCVLGSGTFAGAYYFCLARGYRASDFTIVYPVARAVPVLLIAMGDVLRGRYPSTAGWLGMILVVAGCFLAPLRSFRDVGVRHYVNRASLWILLTALGTVGYTLLDKIAAETVQQGGPATAARYGYFFHAVSFVVYSLLRKTFDRHDPSPASVGWKLPAVGALMGFSAYWLVLWAYQLASRASYIVAFRQFSIVIGVVVAFVAFKEHGKAVRLTATALITAGLLVIGVWGN